MGSTEVKALQTIDLDIYPNEFVALMGPSGSGKSTLMNLLGCLDTPSAGEYLLSGEQVSEMDDDDLATIRSQGITAIVNLCAECYDLHSIEINAGFNVYFMPIPDEESPALEELERALSWVKDCVNSGKKVLVHCRFGIGRTGTLVTAYLMEKGYSLKKALRKIHITRQSQ